MSNKPHLAVAGGGPAGLSASVEAARHGMAVTLLEAGQLGGQYFKGRPNSNAPGSPRWFRAEGHNIRVRTETNIIDAPESGILLIWSEESGIETLKYDALVIATGAIDRPVALPGWTLPGVITAGAAHTLATVHGVVPGRRVVVGGSGPFLYAVALALVRLGCEVHLAEATTFTESIRGIPVLLRDPTLLRQSASYLIRLAAAGVRPQYQHMITAVDGNDRVTGVTMQQVDADWYPREGTEMTVEADAVCLGFGFTPRLALSQRLGCRIRRDDEACEFAVWVDEGMRTSVQSVYAAGEITGVAGVRCAITEGRLAGLSAARDAGTLVDSDYQKRIRTLRLQRENLQVTAAWMRRGFGPRPGLWSLADAETVLCRCENISLDRVQATLPNSQPTPRTAKTFSRSGMGRCQGTVCGTYLIEWLHAHYEYSPPESEWPWSIRPPIHPIPLADWIRCHETLV
jgi:thioredoxin reductase